MIEYPLKKNYLGMIENAVKGENSMFRNFYMVQDGTERDALENGALSCAVFVSSILYLQNNLLKELWLKSTHANVGSTIKDMVEHGWVETSELKPGAVVVWEQQAGHEHIGFFVGGEDAISNDSRGTGFPHKHHITYNDTRKVEKILWHAALD